MPKQPESTLAPNAQGVFRLARELGFAMLGIAPALPGAHGEHVRQWLARGEQGEMTYLAEHVEQRLDPRVLLPGARSIICAADVYDDRCDAASGGDGPSQGVATGRIARYAWGTDYHRVIKKRLHALADALRERWPQHQYLTTVDTAPILEREHAQLAGLGWVGKHTLLIHPELGSWMLLGEIVTTLPLQAGTTSKGGGASAAGVIADHCGTCTRCLDACPTQCITPYQVDAHRCISYLTLEHRGLIDPALHEAMGDWLAGCDVCQEVCPFNQPPRATRPSPPPPEGGWRVPTPGEGRATEHQPPTTAPQDAPAANAAAPPAALPGLPNPAYAARPPAPAIPLLEVLNWDAAARQRAFERSALKRVKLDQLKRNALIAAGNHLRRHPDDQLRQRVREVAGDPRESALVRTTARQVMAQDTLTRA